MPGFNKNFISGLQENNENIILSKTEKNIILDFDIGRYNAKNILKISKRFAKIFNYNTIFNLPADSLQIMKLHINYRNC